MTYYAGHLPEEAHRGPAELERTRVGNARAIVSPVHALLAAPVGLLAR